MRAAISAAAAAAAVALTPANCPAQGAAQPAWKTYVSGDLGMSFSVPGDVKSGVGTFRGDIAGPRQTIFYRSVDGGIEYRVTVMSFLQAKAEGATILGEREYMFQNGKKVLSDTFARAGSGNETVYGRKFVVDLPGDKGRSTAVFYFTKGRLVSLEATVPPGGDASSPDPGRFVDSLAFTPPSPAADAIALATPAFE